MLNISKALYGEDNNMGFVKCMQLVFSEDDYKKLLAIREAKHSKSWVSFFLKEVYDNNQALLKDYMPLQQPKEAETKEQPTAMDKLKGLFKPNNLNGDEQNGKQI